MRSCGLKEAQELNLRIKKDDSVQQLSYPACPTAFAFRDNREIGEYSSFLLDTSHDGRRHATGNRGCNLQTYLPPLKYERGKVFAPRCVCPGLQMF